MNEALQTALEAVARTVHTFLYDRYAGLMSVADALSLYLTTYSPTALLDYLTEHVECPVGTKWQASSITRLAHWSKAYRAIEVADTTEQASCIACGPNKTYEGRVLTSEDRGSDRISYSTLASLTMIEIKARVKGQTLDDYREACKAGKATAKANREANKTGQNGPVEIVAQAQREISHEAMTDCLAAFIEAHDALKSSGNAPSKAWKGLRDKAASLLIKEGLTKELKTDEQRVA